MRGRVHIGLSMLLHDKKRLLLSSGGIAFAVIIMFLQLGFFNGINDSQANIARLINADLVMLHKNRTHLNKWNAFDPVKLSQVVALPEVADGIPIYKDGAGLKNPQTDQVKRIIIYAFPPESRPFELPDLTPELQEALKIPGNVLFDSRSRDIYGRFSLGDTLTVNEKPFTLAGEVTLGPNLINDGTLLMSAGSWVGSGASNRQEMALLRLEPGQDKAAAIARVRANLPEDIIVLTPAELAQREIMYTVINAPVGAIFGVGLIVSLFIGTVICYQVLFNEVFDNLSQYATLKAMGFGPRYLIAIILEEALSLAVAGFLPGLAVSWWTYSVVADHTRLIMYLTPERIGLIFAMALTMCVIAGLLAMRKVLKVDPADLF